MRTAVRRPCGKTMTADFSAAMVFSVARSGCPLRALLCVVWLSPGDYSTRALPVKYRYRYSTVDRRVQSVVALNLPSSPFSRPCS